jgi:hypothetical protein
LPDLLKAATGDQDTGIVPTKADALDCAQVAPASVIFRNVDLARQAAAVSDVILKRARAFLRAGEKSDDWDLREKAGRRRLAPGGLQDARQAVADVLTDAEVDACLDLRVTALEKAYADRAKDAGQHKTKKAAKLAFASALAKVIQRDDPSYQLIRRKHATEATAPAISQPAAQPTAEGRAPGAAAETADPDSEGPGPGAAVAG